jgi:methylated-DNA-protein-cysteine methyltransferase-like protein
MDGLEEVWRVVKTIPRGRVASYGEVGRRLRHPASGFLVGRWMAQAPAGVPWWRVIAKTGEIVTSKRSPHLAAEQERRLRAEGVPFVAPGVVDFEKANAWPP